MVKLKSLALSLPLIALLWTLTQFIIPAFPTSSFSTENAMRDVALLARAPRPPQSPHHQEVQRYIQQELTALGLRLEIQSLPATETTPLLENIVARRPGTDSDGAILLLAHYDSETTTPGAGDNATGTAVVLEIAREIVRQGPQKNDLIFLFTDGEELGAIGAAGFAAHHPWMADVKVALNFDTLTVGPAYLWQTNEQNGHIIQYYLQAVPSPHTNAWTYDLSRLLPMETDLTPFLNQGTAGYNFSTAYLYPEIQTAQDLPAIVSPQSLHHAGSQGLALAIFLANARLDSLHAPDLIYFNLGTFVITYPTAWAIPLQILACGLFLATFFLSKTTPFWKDLWPATLRALIITLLLLFIVGGSWLLGLALKPQTFARWIADPRHTPYDGIFFAGLIFLTVGFLALTYRQALKKTAPLSLLLGNYIGWIMLGLLSSLYLPGTSYLFTWPLLINLSLIIGIFLKKELRLSMLFAALLTVTPILLWIPFLGLTFLVTALNAFPLLILCQTIFTASLLPLFTHLPDSIQLKFGQIALIGALLLWLTASFLS